MVVGTLSSLGLSIGLLDIAAGFPQSKKSKKEKESESLG